MYWFTIEFGLCRQDGEIRAFGAGLLSSFGELKYCLTDVPQKLPLDPEVTCNTDYPITKFQPTYFVADDFESAKKKLRYVVVVYLFVCLFTCCLPVVYLLFTCCLHVVYTLFTCCLHVVYLLCRQEIRRVYPSRLHLPL